MLLSALRLLSSIFGAVGIVALVLALCASTPLAFASEPLSDSACDGCVTVLQEGDPCYGQDYQSCIEGSACDECDCYWGANGLFCGFKTQN